MFLIAIILLFKLSTGVYYKKWQKRTLLNNTDDCFMMKKRGA
ncbi:conserved hypothetical protein, partial [Listeria innocua FSL S4-378]